MCQFNKNAQRAKTAYLTERTTEGDGTACLFRLVFKYLIYIVTKTPTGEASPSPVPFVLAYSG